MSSQPKYNNTTNPTSNPTVQLPKIRNRNLTLDNLPSENSKTSTSPSPSSTQLDFHKTQHWIVRQNTDLEQNCKLEKIDPYAIKTLNNWRSRLQGGLGMGTRGPNGTYNLFNPSRTFTNFNISNNNNNNKKKALPQWLKYDKNVLKFKGYFCEHVNSSAYENFRIRKLNIYYYLEDDTMHMDEVKEENSGIPQGYFVKRQRVQKDGEEKGVKIHWKDINLGKIRIFNIYFILFIILIYFLFISLSLFLFLF